MRSLFKHKIVGLIKSRLLIGIIVLLAISSSVVHLFPQFNAYLNWNYSIENYRYTLANLSEANASDVFHEAPIEFRNNLDLERQYLMEIIIANTNGDSKAEFEARLEYERINNKMVHSGNSTELPISADRRLVFYEQLVANEQFYVFSSIDEMTASYYIASQSYILSPFMLFVPACVVYAVVFSSAQGTRSKRVESILPMNNLAVMLINLVVGIIGTLSILVLSLLPVAIYHTVCNGFGDLSYPVLDIVNNAIVQTTVGGFLLKLLSLVIMGSCFIGTVAMLISTFTDNRTVMLLILCICGFLPNTSGTLYPLANSALGVYNPLVYLSIHPVIGLVYSMENPYQLVGTTFSRGTIVLISSTVILFMVSLALDKLIPQIKTLFGAARATTRNQASPTLKHLKI
jgi:hypothetical protein